MRLTWGWVRALAAATILGVLLWRLGTEAFLQGLRQVDAWSLAAAIGIAALTTLCSAWRWTLVARGLGVAMPLRHAVAACYRSLFLNVATPGGVVGDVHRAVRHGRQVGDLSRGLRAVVWERLAGQVVLIASAAGALSVLPSPVRRPVRVVGLVLLAAIVGMGLAAVVVRSAFALRWPTTVRRAGADLRAGLLAWKALPGILLASALAVAGYVLTFLIAARTVGSSASLLELVPLAMLVLVAMGLPNVAGWGPREGMAAWAFGAGGIGAELGVATAVVYGVMVFIGALPGAVLLATAKVGRRAGGSRSGSPEDARARAAGSAADGARHV